MTFRMILYSFLPILLANESRYVLVSFLLVFFIFMQACVFVDFVEILSSSVKLKFCLHFFNYIFLN